MEYSIQHFSELPSTNTYALQQAELGAKEGLVVVADYQSDGRGKPGRKWVSQAGQNLLFSILLRPAIGSHKAPMITQIACRSIAAVLQKHFQLSTAFKRPNDVLIKNKKICGVLTEAQSQSNGRIDTVIVGVGLNVNSEASELLETATSIKAETGNETSRSELLNEILYQFKIDIEDFYDHSA